MSLQSIIRERFRRLQPTPRCSTCTQARSDTRRLVSGRSAYVCEECVEAALARREQAVARLAGKCVFCNEPHSSMTALGNGRRGACDDCLHRAQDVLTHA